MFGDYLTYLNLCSTNSNSGIGHCKLLHSLKSANSPRRQDRREAAAPSHVRMEQLRARKLEIDDAGQQLVREYWKIDEEMKRRGDSWHACATTRVVH